MTFSRSYPANGAASGSIAVRSQRTGSASTRQPKDERSTWAAWIEQGYAHTNPVWREPFVPGSTSLLRRSSSTRRVGTTGP